MNSVNDYWAGVGLFQGLGPKNIDRNYSWPITSIPEGVRFSRNSQDSIFIHNVELKFELSRIWKESPDRRFELVRYIVSTWGGIRGNKSETLVTYSDMDQSSNYFPLKGVASYSKVLGIIDPHKYAIYDARVAVALNAVQLLAKTPNGKFFPYLAGRNKITGHSAKKIGFSQDSKFRWGSRLFNGWTQVLDDFAYHEYLFFLNQFVKSELGPLYLLEMALFSDAEELAIRCTNEFNNHS